MSDPVGLKILFAGTPDFAAQHLQALLQSKHQVIAVYTQPDRPAGRGKKLQASAVKSVAEQAQVPVCQPRHLKDAEEQKRLAEFGADIMVVVAYGLLLPTPVLTAPRLGCINVHASLLPRWRGAAPIARAIEAGDTETGITIMQMDRGLDTGDMLLRTHCPIQPNDDAQDLHDRLAALGPSSLLAALDQIAEDGLHGEKQDDSLATYAHKLSKDEARIDWSHPAAKLHRQVRAFNPYPVAFTELDGERLRIFTAKPEPLAHKQPPGTLLPAPGRLLVACGDDSALELLNLQLPGKKALSAAVILNGFAQRFAAGKQLGQ